jgi:hypothetical protein
MGGMRNAYSILGAKPERKRSHGRPRCKCEENIKTNLTKIMCEVVNFIRIFQ